MVYVKTKSISDLLLELKFSKNNLLPWKKIFIIKAEFQFFTPCWGFAGFYQILMLSIIKKIWLFYKTSK